MHKTGKAVKYHTLDAVKMVEMNSGEKKGSILLKFIYKATPI